MLFQAIVVLGVGIASLALADEGNHQEAKPKERIIITFSIKPTRPLAPEPKPTSPYSEARRIGVGLQYQDTNGVWITPLYWYVADRDGISKSGMDYHAGDILFETVNQGWLKAKPNIPHVPIEGVSEATVPNPDGVPLLPVEQRLVALTNQIRAQHGLRPLRVKKFLQEMAPIKAVKILEDGKFKHATAPNPKTFNAGENIAMGENMMKTAQAAINSWMNSPGHRANILDGRYETIGVGGVVLGKGTGKEKYGWVQMFQ